MSNNQETNNKLQNGKVYFNITKLGMMLTSPDITKKECFVLENTKDTTNQAPASVTLSSALLDMGKINITPFDINIMDTVYTMYEEKKASFTIEELANRLVRHEVKFDGTKQEFDNSIMEKVSTIYLSRESSPNLSPNDLNFYNYLHFCVSKLALIQITINCRDNPLRFGADRILQYQGMLLPVNAMLYQTGVTKEEKIKYEIANAPVLYTYAQSYRRIAAAPARMLNSPLRVNKENISLTHEVVKFISRLKNKNNNFQDNELRYVHIVKGEDVGLLRKLEIDRNQYASKQTWSKKKNKIHKDLGILLQKHQDSGDIRAFEPIVEKRVAAGYRIFV